MLVKDILAKRQVCRWPVYGPREHNLVFTPVTDLPGENFDVTNGFGSVDNGLKNVCTQHWEKTDKTHTIKVLKKYNLLD